MPVATISAEELKKRLDSGEEIVILDVRQPEEKREGSIPTSILIPLGELPIHINELEPFKDREIIVHCRTGMRSAQACQFLSKEGFKTVNLTGGIKAWNEL